MQDPQERYLHSAVSVMLLLAMLAAGVATLIHWLGRPHQMLDLIVPPTMFALFAGLLVALRWRPRWMAIIARTALLASGLALAAPSWLYTLQAAWTPGLHLIDIFPPVASLSLVLMVMVVVFLPSRQALRVALPGWCLIALPVLAYLLTHPGELDTPRGKDLLMSYGPVMLMLVVLLPVQRGLAGRIKRLVSERSRMEGLINKDPLTQVGSRRLSEQLLRDILDMQTPAGVIMFDMDRFKAINDTHGHPVGDRVLKTVALRCQEVLRKDETLSRWGGEEFVVIVPGVGESGLRRVAERLRRVIAGSAIEPVLQVTGSFGVTVVGHGDDLEKVLQRVDQALYQAKQRGGNCVVSWQASVDPLGVPGTR